MEFRADFWVVVGTAAPVLLVTQVVAVTQQVESIRIPAKGWSLAATLLALAGLLLSCVLLVIALDSLANERDAISKSAAVNLTSVTLFCMLWQLVAWAARRSEDPEAHDE